MMQVHGLDFLNNLLNQLRANRWYLHAESYDGGTTGELYRGDSQRQENAGPGDIADPFIYRARHSPKSSKIVVAGPTWCVSPDMHKELNRLLNDDSSEVRKLSTWPIERSFVYVDISDFSRMDSGMQLLVVSSFGTLTDPAQWASIPHLTDLQAHLEAMMCIGDGYVYVFRDPWRAAYFAAVLAGMIEHYIASKAIPEFHFRMGVHCGPVRLFQDHGRGLDLEKQLQRNYVGDGINGGNRVLSAVGKSLDDVIFISGEVRLAVSKGTPDDHGPEDIACRAIRASLDNRGRHADKHGKLWRVYQVNHTALLERVFPARLPFTNLPSS